MFHTDGEKGLEVTSPADGNWFKRAASTLACPAGATLDLTQVRAVWVFLKGGTFTIDNLRAEGTAAACATAARSGPWRC